MAVSIFSAQDEQDLFSHQDTHGAFRLFAIIASGLNYLDGLNRKRLDPLCPAPERDGAARRLVDIEGKLYRYIQKETPISYFDTDFKEETSHYILARQLFLKATAFTFKRHRFQFLLQLLRLYRDDPCSILPEREIMQERLETELFQHYILLDMGWKNTEDIGREAISNGYHECDYTLDIEDVWKQPTKAVPPSHIKYVLQSLKDSSYAVATAQYILAHPEDVKAARWVVDVKAIEKARQGELSPVTAADIQSLKTLYHLV